LKARIALIQESFLASEAARQLEDLGVEPTITNVIEAQAVEVLPVQNEPVSKTR